MNKILYRLMFAIVVMIGIFVIYANYLILYPVKTLVVSSAVAVTKEIRAGDLFIYRIDYCKYTQAPAVVYRTFHMADESHIETFPSVETISVPGCNTTKVPLQTYFTMPSGTYYLLVDAVFQVNVLRQEHVIFRTDNFTIK